MNRFHRPFTALAATGLTAFLLSACMSGNTGTDGGAPQESARKPGQIRLVSMNGLSKGSLDSTTTHFTLDTARASFQQYFILQNTGDFPVTDIELTTDNPNFTFSPSHIAVLPPSAGASLIQVIKLNVVHGKRLDAVGYDNYLAPGPVTVQVTVNGSTVDEDDSTLAVEDAATLETYAQIARFTLNTDVDTFELGDLMSGTTFNPVYGNSVPHYYVPMDSARSTGNGILFHNTGNVTLYLSGINPHTYATQPPVALPPDSTYAFNSAYLEVDAKGVIFAPADLPVSTSGKVRFIAYPDF
jgi:hypothetical protein